MIDRYKPLVHEVNATVRMGAHPEGEYVRAADYDALAVETTAYVDKLVAEKREMEAALTKVHGIVAEYWGPCPGSVETLLTIRDVLGTKNWRPNVDFMPRLLTPSETFVVCPDWGGYHNFNAGRCSCGESNAQTYVDRGGK